MHHTPRAQAVRRAQARAQAEVQALPFVVRLFAGWIVYLSKEPRYEREELRKLKRAKDETS